MMNFGVVLLRASPPDGGLFRETARSSHTITSGAKVGGFPARPDRPRRPERWPGQASSHHATAKSEADRKASFCQLEASRDRHGYIGVELNAHAARAAHIDGVGDDLDGAQAGGPAQLHLACGHVYDASHIVTVAVEGHRIGASAVLPEQQVFVRIGGGRHQIVACRTGERDRSTGAGARRLFRIKAVVYGDADSGPRRWPGAL